MIVGFGMSATRRIYAAPVTIQEEAVSFAEDVFRNVHDMKKRAVLY